MGAANSTQHHSTGMYNPEACLHDIETRLIDATKKLHGARMGDVSGAAYKCAGTKKTCDVTEQMAKDALDALKHILSIARKEGIEGAIKLLNLNVEAATNTVADCEKNRDIAKYEVEKCRSDAAVIKGVATDATLSRVRHHMMGLMVPYYECIEELEKATNLCKSAEMDLRLATEAYRNYTYANKCNDEALEAHAVNQAAYKFALKIVATGDYAERARRVLELEVS